MDWTGLESSLLPLGPTNDRVRNDVYKSGTLLARTLVEPVLDLQRIEPVMKQKSEPAKNKKKKYILYICILFFYDIYTHLNFSSVSSIPPMLNNHICYSYQLCYVNVSTDSFSLNETFIVKETKSSERNKFRKINS
jgi:hypothetical protein